MHVSIHPCIHAYHTNPRPRAGRAAPRPCFGLRTGASFPALPPPAQPWPPPEGRTTAQLRKGAKERNPRLGGARCCSSGPLPSLPVPTPTVPSSGRAGMRRCEGVLPCSARTKPTAGARGRAPSRWQRRAGGAELQVGAPAVEREGGLEGGERFAPCFSWAAPSCSCVPNDLWGWLGVHLFAVPHPYLPLPCPFRSPISPLFSPPYSIYLFSSLCLFFFFNLFPFFFSIEKQCWFDFWKPLWAFKRQFERPYRAVLRGKEVMGPS